MGSCVREMEAIGFIMSLQALKINCARWEYQTKPIPVHCYVWRRARFSRSFQLDCLWAWMTNSRTQSKPTAAKPGSIKALSYLIKASKMLLQTLWFILLYLIILRLSYTVAVPPPPHICLISSFHSKLSSKQHQKATQTLTNPLSESREKINSTLQGEAFCIALVQPWQWSVMLVQRTWF